MAGDKQPKTKAELLRELQSIQHLLNTPDDEQFPALDDDDIPLLDAFLDDDSATLDHEDADTHAPLVSDKETLDALNAAYAALTGELDQLTRESEPKQNEKTAEKKPAQQPVAQAAPRTNAPSHPEQAKQAHKPAPAHAKPRPHEPENRHKLSQASNSGFEHNDELEEFEALELDADTLNHLTHPDPSAPAPLPGQQSLFESVKKSVPATGPASAAKEPSAPEAAALVEGDHLRPAQVTKASGENPFLPQHIRERLRGNQPLPKGEFLLPMTPPAYMDMDQLYQPFNSTGLTPKQQETLAGMQQEALAKQHSLDSQAKQPAAKTQSSEHAPTKGVNNTAENRSANVKSPTKAAKPDLAEVINEVIEEFLPLIATRLRERLTETLGEEEPRDR